MVKKSNGRMIKTAILTDDLIDPAYFTFYHTFDWFMAATSSTILRTNILLENQWIKDSEETDKDNLKKWGGGLR